MLYLSPTPSHLSKRIFILGPSHHHYTKICELSRHALYSTPIGPLKLDTEVIASLRATKEFHDMTTEVDEDEHSIEMQLPFMAYMMKDAKQPFTIVPILVGALSTSGEKKFGDLLSPYFADPDNFFIISSDFCHWGARFRYQYMESGKPPHEAIEHLDRMGMELIEKQDADGFVKYLNEYENTICGRHPISVMLRVSKENASHAIHAIKCAQLRSSPRCSQLDRFF